MISVRGKTKLELELRSLWSAFTSIKKRGGAFTLRSVTIVLFVFVYQLALFPDVAVDYLDQLATMHTGPMAVNNICNALLESKYPKKTSVVIEDTPSTSTSSQNINYYSDFNSSNLSYNVKLQYDRQAIALLSTEFRMVIVNFFSIVTRESSKSGFIHLHLLSQVNAKTRLLLNFLNICRK